MFDTWNDNQPTMKPWSSQTKYTSEDKPVSYRLKLAGVEKKIKTGRKHNKGRKLSYKIKE